MASPARRHGNRAASGRRVDIGKRHSVKRLGTPRRLPIQGARRGPSIRGTHGRSSLLRSAKPADPEGADRDPACQARRRLSSLCYGLVGFSLWRLFANAEVLTTSENDVTAGDTRYNLSAQVRAARVHFTAFPFHLSGVSAEEAPSR